MTQTDLTALMLAIDECGDRLAAETSMLDAAKARVHDLDIEHAALMRALALAQASPQPAPVQETKPKEPREVCAEVIEGLGVETWEFDKIAQYLAVNGHDFKERTIRRALTLLHANRTKANRAAETEQDDSHLNRSDAREASLSLAPNSGAVTSIDEAAE